MCFMKNINIVSLIWHSFDWLSLSRGGPNFVLGVSCDWYSTDFLKLTSAGQGVVHFHNMWKQLDLRPVKGFTRRVTIKKNVCGPGPT